MEYPDEFTDEEIEQAERQGDMQEEVYGETAPSYRPKPDLYNLFWKVVKTRDSSKVGNLGSEELGVFDISVRDCFRIAMIADTLGHHGFADFFIAQAEIALSTSASKEGWLPELFVSQRKLSQRTKKAEIKLPERDNKGLFKKRQR